MCKNPLTSCHGLYRNNSNLPLLVIFITAIALVSDPNISSAYTATLYSIRMFTGPATKRARAGTSRPNPAKHHTSTTTTARQSQQGQGRVLVNPSKISPDGRAKLAEELRENRYGDKVCTMCSDVGVNHTFRHHHFSSTAIRRLAASNNSTAKTQTYMCPVCKAPEPVVIPAADTRRVVLADSTLYGVWDHMLPSKVHFDIDTIVGGRVKDMTRALQKNYLHLPNRLEIIVVAGINNIGAGHKAEQILEEVKELKAVLKEHSERWQHSTPSYAAFCTVMYAPKFCSLHVPPSPPEPWVAAWTPPANFHNRAEEVRKLNDMIIQMQRAESLELVRLDYMGIKRFKSGTVQHKFDNKEGATPIWREQEVFKKLHFTRENKVKIMEHIIKCFMSNSQKFASKTNGHD